MLRQNLVSKIEKLHEQKTEMFVVVFWYVIPFNCTINRRHDLATERFLRAAIHLRLQQKCHERQTVPQAVCLWERSILTPGSRQKPGCRFGVEVRLTLGRFGKHKT